MSTLSPPSEYVHYSAARAGRPLHIDGVLSVAYAGEVRSVKPVVRSSFIGSATLAVGFALGGGFVLLPRPASGQRRADLGHAEAKRPQRRQAATSAASSAKLDSIVDGAAIYLRVQVRALIRRPPMVAHYLKVLERRLGIDLITASPLRRITPSRGTLTISLGVSDYDTVNRLLRSPHPPAPERVPVHLTRLCIELRARVDLGREIPKLLAGARWPTLLFSGSTASQRRRFFATMPIEKVPMMKLAPRIGLIAAIANPKTHSLSLFRRRGRSLTIDVLEHARRATPSTLLGAALARADAMSGTKAATAAATMARAEFFRGEATLLMRFEQLVGWGKLAALLEATRQLADLPPANRHKRWPGMRRQINRFDSLDRVRPRPFRAFYASYGRGGAQRGSGWLLTAAGRRAFAAFDLVKLVSRRQPRSLAKALSPHFPPTGPLRAGADGLGRAIAATGHLGQQLLGLFLWPNVMVWAAKHRPRSLAAVPLPGVSGRVRVTLDRNRLQLIPERAAAR